MTTFIAVLRFNVNWYNAFMWIGEQITQKGIGNGASLIIFAGIVSAPGNWWYVELVNNGQMNFLTVIAIL